MITFKRKTAHSVNLNDKSIIKSNGKTDAEIGERKTIKKSINEGNVYEARSNEENCKDTG